MEQRGSGNLAQFSWQPMPMTAEIRVTAAERALAEQVRAECALLAYPDRPWVVPITIGGEPCLDVLIVGGGQSGLAIAHGLRRDAVPNLLVLDERPAGIEGVWEYFARMPELRTPKTQSGMDFGQPNLSPQRWYQARYGMAAWDAITRIPRQDWMAYLRWYRATLDLPVRNQVAVTAIGPGPRDGVLAVQTSEGTRFARRVVLATGFEGAGGVQLPAVVTDALPRDRYDHACEPVDFAALLGKRVGILGHGASAFDAAVAALQEGATRVDLCFRRTRIPEVNPHRHLEQPGLMAFWSSLSDRVRWNIARHMRLFDQPPALASYNAALALPGFHLHGGSPWQTVALEGSDIVVVTPREKFRFDHLICATGYALNLAARPELRQLAGRVALWRDRFTPDPAEALPELGAFPYLGEGYEFLPNDPADAWVSRVHAFNFASFVTAGPHSTGISGHKHALPRLVRAVQKSLLLEQQDGIVDALRAYNVREIEAEPADG